MRRGLFAAFAVALLFATTALAQSTGGSFGGGSFGSSHSSGSSSSGSSSSGSSSSGSSRSYGGSSSSGSSHSYGGSSSSGSSRSYGGNSSYYGTYSNGVSEEVSLWWTIVGSIALSLVIIVIANGHAERQRQNEHLEQHRHQSPPELCDVTAISLAIDWRARERIQKKLEALARTGNTSSSTALTHMLHETVAALRGADISWLYASAVSTTPTQLSKAEPLFRSIANDMRSRFRHEVVRNASGTVVEDEAPEIRAREAEGKGVVVVTLLVAARRGIRDIAEATNATELRIVLKILGALAPDELVALEVIWSPAAEHDRMSTAELEAIYPELRKIREDTIAGRVFCGYCSGPFAAELDRCPHCGAPASDATKTR